MPTTINASNTSGGAIITPDGSGVLELQSGGVTALTANGANVTVAGSLSAAGGINISGGITGTLPVANGGTGATTLAANNVLLGNGTSALQAVAPGAAGNLLTSNGTTWTSAAPAPSSGTLQAVASGNLADGSTVVINANGTVSVVSGVAQAFGTPVGYSGSQQVSSISATYDSAAQRVVVAYTDTTNNNFGTAVVGTVSGTSITFGTPVVFRSAQSTFISATYDSNAQRVVIAWLDQNQTGFAVVATVSGTSITFGSLQLFNSSVPRNISATYHAAAGRIVIAFTNGSSVNQGLGVAGLVSGTDITFGSASGFAAANINSVSTTYDSNAQRVVVAYADGSNGSFGTAVVGTVSGTSITFGTPVVFRSASINGTSATYDSNAQRVVIAYLTVNDGAVNVGTVSGTSITFGAPVTFQAGMSNNGASIIYDSNAQRVVVFYQRSSDSLGVAIAGTVSGNLISFGAPTTLPTGSIGWSAVYDAAQQRIVVAYRPNNTGFGAAAVFTTGVTNLTTENFIGFSNGAYTNGQTATIQLVGSVDDAQSGLTPARAYFVQPTGGIGLTPAIPSVFAGTAVAANRIIVKG